MKPVPVAALAACLAFTVAAFAVEPWADPRLPVTNGLALWFDVSRQNAARGAREQSPLRSWNDAPDVLFDGSGRRRDARQPRLDARPAFLQWNAATFRFDGTNDFLAVAAPGWEAPAATVFLVANPQRVGSFTGPFAAAAAGRNDYQSGLNLDFGGAQMTNLARVNAEGAGFSGEADLLAGPPEPLNRWHVFTLAIGEGPQGVRLFLDGQPRGARPRNGGGPLHFEEFTLGARRYSNTPDRPHVQGFFGGEFAELLVFGRALPDAERAAVERYLDEKYGVLLRGLGGAPLKEGAVPLVAVSNPPPVQVHRPGFRADELPVRLNNVNNVRYRADGALVATGYDGRIWLLRDTDGDGLEDAAALFHDGRSTIRAPIGAALTPPGYARGDGLFLAAKDRLVLLVDTNRDDRADAEITVATWTERSEQQGVDALGVALAMDGSVYFSLGAASFTEPFLIEKSTGQARYRTTMERGTIQRVSPDFATRETVATGIRFAVGLAFNREGDLFATDQEGATWRHDGNPFDELLHIQAGRHYGFPPRHPRHLPDVWDEPSVFDYVPQHQSTCGLCFNDPVNGGPPFGPALWAGDVFVAGYSRGKLWRTKLVKIAAGYVAQTELFATLQSLAADVCVSPRGDLIVASHGGQPDWGGGPNGGGHLWRIRYEDRQAPQPVAAWNAGPTELVIEFDRPVPAAAVKGLTERARIESGAYVFPGDRFETIRPGYQVVYDQLAAPRHAHEILGTRLSPDGRQLTLLTRPRTAAVNYVVTLPSAAETDLLTTLHGLEAEWTPAAGGAATKLWLPHLDLDVTRAFTAGSAAHSWTPSGPGRLAFRGQLDLHQMLQPAIQPGAAIDWERPPEDVTVAFESSRAFAGELGGQALASQPAAAGRHRAAVTVRAPGPNWQPFALRIAGEGGPLDFTASWQTPGDPRPRAFPLRRFLLPWALPGEATLVPAGPREIPEIAGGNWLRGRRLFHGDQLACAKCHAIHGEGARVGPDLSNLTQRDYASIRQDIEFPNAALNPDHVASVIELTDGEALTGIIQREQNDVLSVVVASGAAEAVPRTRVKAVRPAAVSLMPEGLWGGMNEAERRDLMTYLLTAPPPPAEVAPELQGHRQPEGRTRSELAGLTAPSTAPQASTPPPLRIVLCASPKDAGHGAPGFHDYPLWRERWARLLGLAENVAVETADRWPSADQWRTADVIAFYHDNPAWAADKAGDLDAFLARGGGLVFLHWSLNAYRDTDALKRRIVRAWGAGGKFRHGPLELAFAPHEITAGFPPAAKFVDETYWNLPADVDADATVLATAVEEGAPQPQVWVKEAGRGRVFVCIPGHFTWTFDDPLYRTLVLRGLAWAAGQPVDRLTELATVGARMAE